MKEIFKFIIIGTLLINSSSSVFAEQNENLLLNGDFEVISDEPGYIPGWKSKGDQWRIVDKDGNHYLNLSNNSEQGAISMSQTIQIDPNWKSLKLTAKVRIKNIKRGKLNWHDARLAICQSSPKSENYYPLVLHWETPQLEWKEYSIDIPIKAGKKTISISPAIFNAAGEMEVDDLHLSVNDFRTIAKPENVSVISTKTMIENVIATSAMGPIEKVSSCREVICLNGIWAFTPAKRKIQPTPNQWGAIRVPGSWSPGRMVGVVKEGKGEVWNGYHYKPSAWYQRNIRIPQKWKDQKVVIDLTRISTDAVVYIDGKKCGSVSFPGGTVDLTDFVTPGEDALLRIFVLAVNDKDFAYRYMGPGAGQLIKEKARLNNRGIVGDVLLKAFPKETLIDHVVIETSTTDEMLTLKINTSNIKKDSPVVVNTEIFDARGNSVKRLQEKFAQEFVAANSSLKLTSSWNNARWWNPNDPYLYKAVVKIENGDSIDEITQTFGFREFRISGKNFFLNGTLIRLRPFQYGASRLAHELSAVDNIIKSIKDFGFNIIEMWPWDRYKRGTSHYDESWMAAADKHGLLVVAPLAEFRQFLGKWDDSGIKEFWGKRIASDIKRYGKHPSVVMWTGGTNSFGFCNDQDPTVIGQKKLASPSSAEYKGKKRKANEAIDIVKKQDPTRPVYWHAGAACGDVYTLNCYLTLMPLQEREEWLSQWAEHGDMPVMMIEFGEPINTTFMRGRHGYNHAQASEPLLTEFSAAFLGSDAYSFESDTYRNAIKNRFVKGQEYKTFHTERTLDREKNCQKLKAEFITKTWRSWRTWGISGGMIPWGLGSAWAFPHTGALVQKDIIKMPDFYPGKRGAHNEYYSKSYLNGFGEKGIERLSNIKVLTEAVSDIMVWIGGAAGAFTDKTHNFIPEQTIEKQAIIINDTPEAQNYTCVWQAFLDGNMIADGNYRGSMKPAEILKEDISFRLPELIEAKVNGEIRMTVFIAGEKYEDSFSFRVFNLPTIAKRNLSIFDPEGDTYEFLDDMGYKLSDWDGGQTNNILVIGRNALDKGNILPGSLEEFVRNGGKAVVFAQRPDYLRDKKQVRVSRYISRNVFPVNKKHPVVAGLDAEDLSDWAGGSSLVAQKVTHAVSIPAYPSYGWHWGNRGGVATSAIEKPHKSGWRPILECEFDLSFSPLMELDYGKGMLVLNMLDVEERGAVEPVASLITNNIIDYLAEAVPTSKRDVYYAGDDKGKKLLESLGVVYESVENSIPESGILVLGDGNTYTMDEINRYAENGGSVFVMPQSSTSKIMPEVSSKVNVNGSISVPNWPECRGLSISDLRWRVNMPATLLKGGCQIGAEGLLGRQEKGKGVILWSQTSPDSFDYKTKTYLRFTRWRQTRMISQLLSNLGASFKSDKNIFLNYMDSAIKLGGEWKFTITKELPGSKEGNPHPDSGVSPEAAQIIAEKTAQGDTVDLPVSIDFFSENDGEAVFCKEIDIPELWSGRELILSLGPVDDFDITYFNGVKIGEMDIKTPGFWNKKRVYKVPSNIVKAGKAIIAVRAFDHFGGGGFFGKKENLFLQPADPITVTSPFYCGDYIKDFATGDDPYRYYRW